MKILEMLFGSRAKTKNAESKTSELDASIIESNSADSPPFDLFVDSEIPLNEQSKRNLSLKSGISIYLDRNYHSFGINDGYEYHSNETLETGKKKIRSEFQLIIDQMVQEKSEQRLQLRMMVVKVEKISEETRRNLDLTIEELNTSISLLQKQKELSAVNEGWVMKAIHNYHLGFVQGLNDYLAGENLLNSIRNI